MTRQGSKSRSSYSLTPDRERLHIQADLVRELDRRAITKALHHLAQRQTTARLRILDAGCADGYVTVTRFGDCDAADIVGLDITAEAVEAAHSAVGSSSFTFVQGDLQSNAVKLGPFDLVFSAHVLHHLNNPEAALLALWRSLRPGGVLIVRASDDGLKLNYPADPGLAELVDAARTVSGAPDRQYGRKLYTNMKALRPEPVSIEMDFEVLSTAGMTADERVSFFDDHFSFQQHYAQRAARTESEREWSRRLARITAAHRARFHDDDKFFSLSVQLLAIAYCGTA